MISGNDEDHGRIQGRPVGDGVGVVTEEAQQPAAEGKGKRGSFWKEMPVLVITALVLALVIKTFVIQAFYIPSESMENTLLVNDRVLVNKLVYRVRDIERGDVVVFSGVESGIPRSRSRNRPTPSRLSPAGSAWPSASFRGRRTTSSVSSEFPATS